MKHASKAATFAPRLLGLAAGALGLVAGPAGAAIIFTGGVGDTVYGVAPYGGAGQPAPLFIGDNVTGFNDILASPGHGFLTANPVIANNISQFGIAKLPLGSFQIGGGNGFGPFGAAATGITGPRVGFTLLDAGQPGRGSLSYAISSWTTNFKVTPGGFKGNLGTFLSVGGLLPAVQSADAVSLVTNYYVNGVYVGQTTPLILAAAGNGNFQALGGSGAAVVITDGGIWRGLAVDLLPAILPAGDTVKAVSTLTEFADPASIDSIAPDLSLLPGLTLPDLAIGEVSGAVPEPASWAMMLLGFGFIGGAIRVRRRIAATA